MFTESCMGDEMGQKRGKWRYLEKRIQILFGIMVPAFILFAFLPQRIQKILVIPLLAGMLLGVHFWIIRPYRMIASQVQRFSDGYISLGDLNDMDVAISPEVERMVRHIHKLVESTRTLDLSKRQAQYRALQNQINPHFLYNTLEGIRSEALIAGLDNLADMTEALAIFFRYTISKVENLVTVEEELENCATYFKIQQYRFGKRIHLEVQKGEEDWEEILHCMIPKLTLQPILENSIIHGIELKMDEGTVKISICRTQSRLIIKVSDDGVGMDRETLNKLNAKLGSKEEEVKNYSSQPETGGVALVNVNNRIHLIFGEEYGMHVFSVENVGTSVELTIPVIMNEGELKKEQR